MSDPVIRSVSPADWAATRAVIEQAFRPEDVATFLDALRADGCLIGEWLAELAGEVVGHVAFSRVFIEIADGSRVAAAMLTPLAVRPDRQRQGIGTRLMTTVLHVLEAQGEALFVVLGHPDYYPRVGFSSELGAQIHSPWPCPAFMARGTNVPHGLLLLPPAIAAAG